MSAPHILIIICLDNNCYIKTVKKPDWIKLLIIFWLIGQTPYHYKG